MAFGNSKRNIPWSASLKKADGTPVDPFGETFAKVATLIVTHPSGFGSDKRQKACNGEAVEAFITKGERDEVKGVLVQQPNGLYDKVTNATVDTMTNRKVCLVPGVVKNNGNTYISHARYWSDGQKVAFHEACLDLWKDLYGADLRADATAGLAVLKAAHEAAHAGDPKPQGKSTINAGSRSTAPATSADTEVFAGGGITVNILKANKYLGDQKAALGALPISDEKRALAGAVFRAMNAYDRHILGRDNIPIEDVKRNFVKEFCADVATTCTKSGNSVQPDSDGTKSGESGKDAKGDATKKRTYGQEYGPADGFGDDPDPTEGKQVKQTQIVKAIEACEAAMATSDDIKFVKIMANICLYLCRTINAMQVESRATVGAPSLNFGLAKIDAYMIEYAEGKHLHFREE